MKARRALQVILNITGSFIRLFVVLLLSGVGMESAYAHVIDRIEINHVGDEAEIQIIFDVRIQYLREASLNNGQVHLFFGLLEADPDRTFMVPESMDSPPSDIAPHFTISYPELDSSLAIKFDQQVKYRVRPGNDGRSISVYIPALKPKIELPAALSSTMRTQEEIELEAKQLIDNARDAMGQNQFATSIEALNKLLNLPPNQQSQLGQKLIGESREKNGEFAKARVEYELYLKIYPDAADVAQVKDRLAHLPAEADKQAARAARKKVIDEKMMVYGSFSQNYYNGVLRLDTNTAGSTTTQTWTGTDQSMLVSSLDLTGRKRTENADTRLVVRESYNANFLPGQNSSNRLNAAYVEQSGRDHSYLYRLGRQMGTAGGVQGRFDGVWLGYSLASAWRVNGVAGSPVDIYGSTAERKTFTGISVDLIRAPEQWSGSSYLIQQRVGEITDRQAIGLETHYFDIQRNYTGLFDYDTVFKAVNIAMFQGNWTTASGGNYNLLVDHRKTPSLQITNALPGYAMQSIPALVQSGVSIETLRDDAQTLTAISNLLMIGTTQPYSAHWRLGGDFRILNTTGTGGVGPIDPLTGLNKAPATQGAGNMYIYSAQAIGNNLLIDNDMGVASASYINAQSYKGQSLAYTQSEILRQYWRLDVSLQLYNQNDNLGVHQARITPSLKLSYHLNDSVSFESEGGIESTHTESATQSDQTQRRYYYVGYRWDFR